MGPEAFTNRDDFEHWLASMDDMLAAFIAQLPMEYQRGLDFSPASLDLIEAWILEKYPNTKSMLGAGEAVLVNGLACYIGETFRKTLGGKWTIRFDDRKFAFFGLPILTGSKGMAAPECPVTLATAAADRRRGTFLRKVLENALRG
jgi:hypothetical protein